jgi:2',3'-cyclic-nucleotide 2'-phosphodiesterase (5'-nucleotidase family)
MRPNTITMLPGDFLAPSLLSSLDKGYGMVDLLNRVGGVGIQYVCFGNHETDVPIEEMRKRIGEFKGVWLNTNMPDFKPSLPDYKIVEVEAGGQLRRVGLIGLLTVDKNLYRPGAFGGGIDTALSITETAARSCSRMAIPCLFVVCVHVNFKYVATACCVEFLANISSLT